MRIFAIILMLLLAGCHDDDKPAAGPEYKQLTVYADEQYQIALNQINKSLTAEHDVKVASHLLPHTQFYADNYKLYLREFITALQEYIEQGDRDETKLLRDYRDKWVEYLNVDTKAHDFNTDAPVYIMLLRAELVVYTWTAFDELEDYLEATLSVVETG